MGTGYRPDYAWIHIPGWSVKAMSCTARGDRGAWPVLLGLSWQHTRGSALLGFVNDDAAYLADRIASGLGTAGSAAAGVTQQPSS